jgi:Transposase DDE domain/Domain of unknown function (DUF4372)
LNRVCSIFAQLLTFFPRLEFAQAVRTHQAERHARGFDCWTQFIAMLFCQLGRAQSLREICGGLAASEGKLKHLGVAKAPKLSTLAYANQHRPWQLYQTVFEQLWAKCQGVASRQRKKFRFRNPLLSIDSTIIDLCLSAFDWAVYQREKGAAKLHLVLDHSGHLPRFAVVTEGKASDLAVARRMQFAAGTMLVFDRGYQDYRWFERLTGEGVYFVTRLRCHARYRIIERRKRVRGSGVQRDWLVQLGAQRYRMNTTLRLVQVRDAQTGKVMVFVTNHLKLAARTVGEIYRQRWEIEKFFRALKQCLRIKTFVGTSANAVQVQIWTALIAMLLLKYIQLRSTFGWSLSNLVALLRQQLFVYRDLWNWINSPYQPPEPVVVSASAQLALDWGDQFGQQTATA